MLSFLAPCVSEKGLSTLTGTRSWLECHSFRRRRTWLSTFSQPRSWYMRPRGSEKKKLCKVWPLLSRCGIWWCRFSHLPFPLIAVSFLLLCFSMRISRLWLKSVGCWLCLGTLDSSTLLFLSSIWTMRSTLHRLTNKVHVAARPREKKVVKVLSLFLACDVHWCRFSHSRLSLW